MTDPGKRSPSPASNPSPELAAANQRLLASRASQPVRPKSATPLPHRSPARSLAEIYHRLPPHLGWESAAVSASNRRRRPKLSLATVAPDCPPDSDTAVSPSSQSQAATIRLQPTLALALLAQGKAATGRLWFLMRHLDQTDRGWLDRAFSRPGSSLHLCSRRHLARLLREGAGLFWTAEKGRLWLKGQAKVAAGLGIERLAGRPVAVPLDRFLGPIGALKAHFYASFHSGRAGDAEYGSPVSRGTITAVSGVPERTQRAYDRRLGLRPRPNITLGPVAAPDGPDGKKTAVSPASSALGQELAWRFGRAWFTFTDRRGHYGRPGQRYHAWRLPNSYPALHPALPRGRQGRVNRQLADLCITRGTGNGSVAARPARYFFQQAAGAGRAWSRKRTATAYWPYLAARRGHWRFWAVIMSDWGDI